MGKRWTEEEKATFNGRLKEYITKKENATKKGTRKLAIGGKLSIAQIRARVHNIINGKQYM